MLKPKLAAWFAEYADYHRHPTNRLTHKIAIPLIVFQVIAMLDWIRLDHGLTVAMILWLAAVAWYLSLNLKLGLIMGVLYAVCIPLGRITPWPVVVGIAVVAWIIQFAGHYVWEKRSPAFFTNILQTLIGPLFFVALLTGDWPEKAATAAPAARSA